MKRNFSSFMWTTLFAMTILHCQQESELPHQPAPELPNPQMPVCQSPTAPATGGGLCCKHTDCESGLCNINQVPVDPSDAMVGTCVPKNLVYIVKPGSKCQQTNPGTFDSPFCSIGEIFFTTKNTYRPYTVIYAQSILGQGLPDPVRLTFNDGKKHIIIGIPSEEGIKPQLFDAVVNKQSSLILDQINLDGKGGLKQHNMADFGVGMGIFCNEFSTLHLLRSNLQNQMDGITAKDCFLKIDQSLILNNKNGFLISFTKTANSTPTFYQITNSIFAFNESPIFFESPNHKENKFAFNFISYNYPNGAMVACSQDQKLEFSVIANNSMSILGAQPSQISACILNRIALGEKDSKSQYANLVNSGQVIPITPDYDGHFRLLDTPNNRKYIIDQVEPTMTNIPLVDFYGVKRPQNGNLDIGHAEFLNK